MMNANQIVKIKRCLSAGALNAIRYTLYAPAFAPGATVGRPRAFTLIELMVVMVIAVVIMAVSLPSFISIGRGTGMRTAVNNVRSTVALSRQWAITHREEITFIAAQDLVYQDDSGDWVTNPAYCAKNQDGEIVQRGVPLPLDVMFASPDGSVVTSLIFKTDGGLANGTGPYSIKLVDKNDAAKTRTISINGLTGGISVK